MVDLELAGHYAELGNDDAVLELVRRHASSFNESCVSDETLSAWRMFERAASRREVTGTFVEALRERVHLARNNPKVRLLGGPGTKKTGAPRARRFPVARN